MKLRTLCHAAKRSEPRISLAPHWAVAAAAATALFVVGCASGTLSVAALLSSAGIQAASGRCAQAIVTYTRVLSGSGSNLVALRGRGSCYAQLGEYAQAIGDYSEVTRATLNPADFLSLATYEWDAGYTSQATSALATASRLAGVAGNVTELLNVAAVQLSYSASAGASITLGRVPISGRLAQWYLLSGNLAGSMFNVQAMTKDFAVAIGLTPISQLAATLVVAANSWWDLGYYQTAISLYQRALSSEGSIDRSQVYVQMGYAYDRMGQLQPAIAAYRFALANGLIGGARQQTEYAIAADFARLNQVLQAQTALASLLHASLTPALRAEVNTLEATLSKEG